MKKIWKKKKRRVIAYVDGFNLYFGLREAGWTRFYWLDIPALCGHLLRDDQDLIVTKYFTSRISAPKDKRDRQTTYHQALENRPGLRVFYGTYKSKVHKCLGCGDTFDDPTEKRSDVSLAVQMLQDAHGNQFDVALLVSGDTDFCPLVEAICRTYKSRRVVVAFPPHRYNSELAGVASAYLNIGRANLAKSQLPEKVTKPNGYELCRPTEWTAAVEEAQAQSKRIRDARRGGLNGSVQRRPY